MMPMTACWPRLVSGVMMSTSTSTLFFDKHIILRGDRMVFADS